MDPGDAEIGVWNGSNAFRDSLEVRGEEDASGAGLDEAA